MSYRTFSFMEVCVCVSVWNAPQRMSQMRRARNNRKGARYRVRNMTAFIGALGGRKTWRGGWRQVLSIGGCCSHCVCNHLETNAY